MHLLSKIGVLPTKRVEQRPMDSWFGGSSRNTKRAVLGGVRAECSTYFREGTRPTFGRAACMFKDVSGLCVKLSACNFGYWSRPTGVCWPRLSLWG